MSHNRLTRVGRVSARVNDRFIQIAKGGDKQAPHSKGRTQEASCFPRVRIHTESGTCKAPDFTLDINKGSLHRGPQATPKAHCPSRKMRYRPSDSDSSHEIVAVQAPVARRHKHPPAPTTVQIVRDDFDAMTQDVDFETASEMHVYDGVTQVHVHKEVLGDGAARYSGVYGEWAERHVVDHRQAPDLQQEDYLYVEELARRVLDAGLNDHESTHSSDKQQHNATIKRHGSEARSGDVERGAKVSMWREDVARNEKDEFGNVVGNKGSDTAQRIQQWRSKSPPISRDIEHLKSGLRRSRSNVSQTYRSERLYTPSDLNGDWSPQAKKATMSKRDKRGTPPSPTRSERIYTMAELKALSKHARTSPLQPQPAAFSQEPPRTRSSNSNSPPRSGKSWPSAPVMGVRSTSTSSVEMVLASCEPTLLHIAPVLAGLGIRREEHLRAFARLREENERQRDEGRGVEERRYCS